MSGRPGDRPRYAAPPDDPARPRLFFAVPIPAPARALIGDLAAQVQATVGDGHTRIRWVRMEGLHLTLRFLGQTPLDRVPALEAIADEVAARIAPFAITVSGAGAFPEPRRPRILWLGIPAGADRLASLAEDLGHRIEAAGWPIESRPFAAHLTIARTDGLRAGPAAAAALQEAAGRLDASFGVDRVVLYRSVLGNGPASYEAIHESVLAGAVVAAAAGR
ncbi:MAG TPA: RNA 2',3'-cyclic phosphodiesterase [Candidatus Eisenbacteria bacterium]|nr:RNA 2',3'-cyclic phosphodiesterase [Candidatus Eisenbacteria bacterium]